MDALALIPDKQSDGYWIGTLSMALALTERHPKVARETLQDFLRSGLPTPELRDMLREEMKKR